MDKPIYTDTYFRIESGYEWGRGMSEEKTETFFAEIRSLFSQNGFTIEERNTAVVRMSCWIRHGSTATRKNSPVP